MVLGIDCGHTGCPKSKPLPNDKKLVSNHTKSYQYLIYPSNKSTNQALFVGIKYYMRDLLSDLNNYA